MNAEASPSLPNAALEGPKFDRALKAFAIVGLGLTALNLGLPTGEFLPVPLLMAQVVAFSVMIMMHGARCLGVKGALIFLLVMAGLEFFSEQVDIITNGGWYGGHFAYSDAWGPRFMGVPFIPPLAIAVIVWPAFCASSMLLYGNYQVDHSKKSWLETLAFAVLTGVFVSWTPFIYETILVEAGAYTYPQILAGEIEPYWDAPLGVWPGFTFLVVLQVVALVRFVGPRFVPRNAAIEGTRLSPLIDLVPVGYFILMAAGLSKVGMTVEAKMVGVYTGTTYGALALFAYVRKITKLREGERE